MKAVVIHEHGDLNKLKWEEMEEPSCPNDKVKIKIKASAINHLDLWVRGGLPGLPIPLPLVLGSDGSGIVVEVGKDVKNWQAGDEIVIQPGMFCGKCEFCKSGMENYCPDYGIIGETENGIQCEYYIANPINLYPKAQHLSFEEAASMQLVFMTAYQMVVKRAQLAKHETILVYGGTSGVGSAAIQIAKDIGARVVTTVGGEKKFSHAEKMGADLILNHDNKKWWQDTIEYQKSSGFDVIVEHVGKITWPTTMRLLAMGGRVVTCGATTGPLVGFDLRHLFMKQQTILGSTMSDIPSFKEVQKKIHDKKYFPFVDKVFHMSKIKTAQKRIANREQFGKVVLVT